MQKYIRLLSYKNAIKVIEFVNADASNDDYANITAGGVSVGIAEENFEALETFLKDLNTRYEIGDDHPYKVEQRIVDMLKGHNVENIQHEERINVKFKSVEKKSILGMIEIISQHDINEDRELKLFTLADLKNAFIAGQDTIIKDLPKNVIIGKVTFDRWFADK